MQCDQIDDIPLLYTRPTTDEDRNKLIIWLNGFSGDKTDDLPVLEEFAG